MNFEISLETRDADSRLKELLKSELGDLAAADGDGHALSRAFRRIVRETGPNLDSAPPPQQCAATFHTVERIAAIEPALGLAFLNRHLARRVASSAGESCLALEVESELDRADSPFEVYPIWRTGPDPLRFWLPAVCPASRILLVEEDPRFGTWAANLCVAPPVLGVEGTVSALGLRAVQFERISPAFQVTPHASAPLDSVARILKAERTLLFGAALIGAAESAFDYAFQYALRRRTFGRPIVHHQAVAMRIADISASIESARLLLLNAIQPAFESAAGDLRVENAWSYGRDCASNVVVQAMQLLGGHGYLTLHPQERHLRDVFTLRALHDGGIPND